MGVRGRGQRRAGADRGGGHRRDAGSHGDPRQRGPRHGDRRRRALEDTFDWFAQDTEGNVWYLGEESKEYEGGEVVSTAGSWEAGVDGALPGVIMWAHPEVGDRYRQEYYPGEAEDMAEVVRSGASESVSQGAYDDLVVIAEWNPLDPGVTEEKYYAAGVGVILEVVVTGGTGRVELVEYEPGS
jgi:hypothetical protein